MKGFIFDLDGVLVDTAKYHFLAWRKLANDLGFDFTEEQNEQLKGISRKQSLEILLKIGKVDALGEEKEKFMDKKNQCFVNYINEMNREELLPGSEEFLKEVKKNNLKIILGSASKNAITILNKLEIVDYFDAIVDGTKVTKAKPDPEVFLKGAEETDILPKNCVVFEDAQAGVEAALEANMLCVGIGKPSVLNKAHIVVPDLSKITVEEVLSRMAGRRK